MATRMQQRRGTAAQWVSSNDGDGPILNAGEIGWESDTNKFKIGDGVSYWADLTYFVDATDVIASSLGGYLQDSDVGAASGVAGLDASLNLVVPGTSIHIEGTTENEYETTLTVTDPTADRTITFPDATGTVVLDTTLDEMAQDAVNTALVAGTGLDKTYNDGSNTITLDIDSTVTTNSGTQTLTNKTVALGSNTVSGTTSEFNTALTDANFVTTGDTGTVTSTMIADGTIVNGDINESAAIALSKLATDPLARANHTGTQTASTISDFDTQVRTSKVTDLAAPTGSFSMNSQRITNLGTPSASTDAATVAYVDAATAGLNVHDAVQAATTAAVTLATDLENGDTLDGVTLATGNRVLVKNQADKTTNGVYVVAASGAPSRATDYNETGEVDAGDFIFVQAGTVNGKTGWVQTNTITTIGSDNIEFTQFSGAGTYTAGNGLTLTGTTFSIDTSITQARVADVSDTEIGYLNGVTSGIQSQLDSKLASATASSTYAPLASPTFTGTVTIPNGAGLGTPTTLTLTNATGLPVSTGISGLASGVSTFLGTPSSANLASAITDETGSGSLVFATSPTLTTPIISQAQSTPSFSSNSYTLVAEDAGKILLASNSSTAGTVSIPTDATTNFAVGTVITILQTGSGQLTISAATPATTSLSSTGATAASPKCRVQYSAITIIKTAANTWYAMGDLS